VKGREARGAAERGHEQDAPALRPRGRGWELVVGVHGAREAPGELDHRSMVMRGVRSTLRIDGSWVREPRRRSPGRGMQPRRLGTRRCT